jgi:hypothetical protein
MFFLALGATLLSMIVFLSKSTNYLQNILSGKTPMKIGDISRYVVQA